MTLLLERQFFKFIAAERRPNFLVKQLKLLGSIALCSVCTFSSACSNVKVYPLPSEDGAGGAGGAGGSGGSGAVDPEDTIVSFAPGPNEGFISEVTISDFGTGQDFGQELFPENIFGPPLGGGNKAGSLDVVSLGDGGSLTFRFERSVVDGPGADFIIFENPFQVGSSGDVFSEFGQVSVSEDGVSFISFKCDQASGKGCAGVNPVLLDGSEGGQGPLSPDEMGGDAFDLAELGLQEVKLVRITDIEGDDDVFDLDAAIALHLKELSPLP